MASMIHHLQTNIAGLLRNRTAETLGELFDMDGNEAMRQLKKLQDKGHKLLPSEGCKHFDPIENGCECRLYNEDGTKK